MENNYDKWSREELLYEVKRLSVELEKVKQLKRLTDDRFVGDGFYQPIKGHYEAYDSNGNFVLSGDTWGECYNDLVDTLVEEARAENCMENIREQVSA